MAHPAPTDLANQISSLMGDRLKTGSGGLVTQLRRARRHLPRKVRGAAQYLAEADQLSHHPRLRAQIDEARLSRSYRACRKHLDPLGRSERRSDLLWATLRTVGFRAFVVLAAFVTFLAMHPPHG
ncbi:hypothetical protein FGG78_32830 [Thioclava sp. BHET1]|nr:hypothetical protein FGG78_32830 [Thioclava sp. BHET1]